MSDTKATAVTSEAPLEPCPHCRPGGNIPNAETIEALLEVERGESIAKFDTLEEMIAWYEREICS